MNAPPDDLTQLVDGEGTHPTTSSSHKDELRLWLRLLATSNLIESAIRRRLRTDFNTTLPRFDLLAQLHRAGGLMTLSAISREMMVSNGNVTGLAARLVSEGLVERRISAFDRRAQTLRLTPKGSREFERQSIAHAHWIAELFAALSREERAALSGLLARAQSSVQAAIAEHGAGP